MSKLEQLIQELCPDGVEIKKLEDVCIFVNGFAFKSNSFKSSGEPVIRITNIKNGFIDSSDIVYIDVADYTENLSTYLVNKDEIVIAMSGATTGKVGINNTNDTFYLNQRVGKFIPKQEILNNHYLYHFLLAKQTYFYSNSGGGAQPNLSTKTIKETLIPVPPIKVQSEIVKILDNFTELTAELIAELTEELTARRKQYEYYRDTLLTFGNDVPMVKLGEIATDIYRGAGIKRDETTPDGIPCVRYGEIYTSYDISFTECISHTSEDVVASPKYFEHGDIIFAITGESVEEIAKSVAYLGDEKCMAGGDTVVMKHKQEPRFISYALSATAAQAQKSKGKVKSKVVHSSVPALKEIEIPLPDMEIQKRIADILDNFHMLCNNISESLPTEIEARQKQYEYYRDKLLTFESAK